MSIADLKPRHLLLVGIYAARHAVRGGTGLVFVFLSLMFGLTVAHLIITPVEMGKKALLGEGVEVSQADLHKELVQFARPVVEWALRGADLADAKLAPDRGPQQDPEAKRWAAFLLDEQPALLSAVWLILLFGLPFLIAVGAFNQLSGDIQTRGLRYQLLRTARSNIFFGRFAATALLSMFLMGIVILTVVVYFGFKIQVYAAMDLASWGLRGFLAVCAIVLPYVAVCSWISAGVDSPFGSLTIANLIIGLVPLFALMGRNTWRPLAYIQYVLPWGVQNDLLHPDISRVLMAAGACGAYTAVFLVLGYRRFARRDL